MSLEISKRNRKRTRKTRFTSSPTPKPVKTVHYGLCGHPSKSPTRTCGSYNCINNYGYGWDEEVSA